MSGFLNSKIEPLNCAFADVASDIPTDVVSEPKSSQKKKRPAPLSVRLSPEQRTQLERDAIGMSLNAYVLSCLFDDQKPKPAHRRAPTKREKAVARALRRLAHSGIAAYLASQMEAVDDGRLTLSPEEEALLRSASTECDELRRDLLEALGLQTE